MPSFHILFAPCFIKSIKTHSSWVDRVVSPLLIFDYICRLYIYFKTRFSLLWTWLPTRKCQLASCHWVSGRQVQIKFHIFANNFSGYFKLLNKKVTWDLDTALNLMYFLFMVSLSILREGINRNITRNLESNYLFSIVSGNILSLTQNRSCQNIYDTQEVITDTIELFNNWWIWRLIWLRMLQEELKINGQRWKLIGLNEAPEEKRHFLLRETH